MPKNKGKGGKKFRRGKHDNVSKREMIWKDFDQAYSIIEKMLGNGRVSLSYYTRDEDNNLLRNSALGIIRGSMRKKIWITPEDVVLISIRDFEEGKVDILHKYNSEESKSLIDMKEIPNIGVADDSKEIDLRVSMEEEPGEVMFSNDITNEFEDEYGNEFIDNI